METELKKTIDTLEVAIDKLERMQVQARRGIKKEERMHLSYVDDMCAESLDPETSQKWEEVKKVLEETRALNE